MKSWRISIVGTGYVGLCTDIGFAIKAYEVVASTNNPKKAASINKGFSPFYESRIQESLQKVVRYGYLKCVLEREEAVLHTDITFITVGTPSQPDVSINLRYVQSSATQIGEKP